MEITGPLLAPYSGKPKLGYSLKAFRKGCFFPSIPEHCQLLVLSLETNRNESEGRGWPIYGLNTAILGSGQRKTSGQAKLCLEKGIALAFSVFGKQVLSYRASCHTHGLLLQIGPHRHGLALIARVSAFFLKWRLLLVAESTLVFVYF